MVKIEPTTIPDVLVIVPDLFKDKRGFFMQTYQTDVFKMPGLTGLWQVSGRSNLPYKDRVWLDSHYVRNWSVWLDLVILVRTVWVVIAGIGAY